jgi:preprotein translocase subunit Sec63
MKRDTPDFMERISLDLEARRMARKILDVDETADKKQLKKAYRRVAMKFHPDKNPHDDDANKKFTLVKCAYELLAKDKACPELLEQINSWPGVPEDDKYRLDNPWGHFLWWREKFFV